MLADLLRASHCMPAEMLPAKASECARAAGFHQVVIYVADLQRNSLRLLAGDEATGGQHEAELHVEGTVPGRAYQYSDVLPAASAGGDVFEWWVPLLDGTERIGLIRVSAGRNDAATRTDMEALAALIALIIVSKRPTSDELAKRVRAQPMSLAAEMQWNLLPPRTYADARVAISASLEPAYKISGDVFEYAVDGPLVHLAIFDAMGHDTAAGLSGALALGAYRNARRQGADLVGRSDAVEAALLEQYDHQRYVTGILATLDTGTGVLQWVNRGHHPPIVIRDNRWTTRLACTPGHPMGTDLGLPTTACQEHLQPGDRVVLYTDGITEARRPGGREFGIERFTDFLIRHHADGLPVPETLRRLIHAVLEYHEGRLQDDATVLLCEWIGPHTEPATVAAEWTGLVPGGLGGGAGPRP
ncbi:Stage II sporulation protein E (SpoIIE) [Streptomyces sp. 1222.5]|uniref:PP2C family protein-serine/threonine phosphatase n=1 Tax=unclassified Streptomyces TaxID=2593676 RepID=UPI0008954FBD|nr:MULTISPECIES: PP2C family protein-serine/threonine phosphatase [unclassified Streptomyces]PKW12196.1 stage II sporulation protein E [Streptomyces sp. 5112.2]SEB60774.1 Stage II sporulation protein E (SpoIIE) [Streptomyces sp. 1222.5]SEE32989.1 Stage II sporulation protein E (SpoIIE) [Streptomyces sp. 2231.1]